MKERSRELQGAEAAVGTLAGLTGKPLAGVLQETLGPKHRSANDAIFSWVPFPLGHSSTCEAETHFARQACEQLRGKQATEVFNIQLAVESCKAASTCDERRQGI